MEEIFARELIQKLPVGYSYCQMIFDDTGKPIDFIYLDANEAYEKMTGLKIESILGRRVTEVVPGFENEGWFDVLGDVAQNGHTREFTRSGALGKWYKSTVYSPKKGYFISVFHDVTEEAGNLQTLRQQADDIKILSNELEMIFNSTQEAILLVSVDHNEFRFQRGNSTYLKLTGLSFNDIKEKTPFDILGFKNGQLVQEHMEQCAHTGKNLVLEEVLKYPAGTKTFLSSYSPIMGNGAVKFIICSRMDISSLKSLEAEREELFKRLHSMFNEHVAVMLIIEPKSGKILEANPAACSFYGYSKEELLNMNIQDINILPNEEVKKLRLKALKNKQRYFVFPHRLKNGEIRMVDVYSSPVTYKDKLQLFSVLFDVTDREKFRKDLNNEKELLDITLNSIGDGVVTVDNSNRITRLNKAAQEITGWAEDDAVGKPFSDIFILKSEETGLPIESPIQKVLGTGKLASRDNYMVLTDRYNTLVPIADSAAPINDSNNQLFGAVMVFRDVRKERENMDKILYLNYHDELTGLYNRRFLTKEMIRLNTESMLPIALIMADVNGLKLTNDVFGHEVGDELLQKVSDVFKEACRKQDIIARWGGDEFLFFLPNTQLVDADKMIQSIKKNLQEKSNKSIQISVSMGCSVKTMADEDINRILQQAEERMYHQKLLEGKNYRITIMNTLLATLYEKSAETEEHARRLSKYCHMIGEELMLSNEEMDRLSLFAKLHDIGKVRVQHSILQKAGPLTESEWEEIKKHPEIGYRIALNTPELSVVAENILSHHERWDGHGYPRGLKGKAIPFLCRILAVADAFDAMTNHKAYRKALSVPEALTELKQNAGTQFDKKIVDVFIELIRENNFKPK